MKKVLVVLFSLAVFVAFSVTTASAGVYISGNLGAVFQNDADIDDSYFGDGELSFDNGGVATFAVGISIDNSVRVELELASRVNDFDEIKFDDYHGKYDMDGDVTTVSFMGNVYFDFKNEGRFTPFIGAGFGSANVEYDSDDLDDKDDDTVMAYQMMLGIGFAATEQLSIDLQYRYFGTADPEIDGVDVEYQTNNVMLGLRYNF